MDNKSFDDWVSFHEENFIPQHTLEKTLPIKVDNFTAKRLYLTLKKPLYDTAYWDIIYNQSKNHQKVYDFSLQTNKKRTNA